MMLKRTIAGLLASAMVFTMFSSSVFADSALGVKVNAPAEAKLGETIDFNVDLVNPNAVEEVMGFQYDVYVDSAVFKVDETVSANENVTITQKDKDEFIRVVGTTEKGSYITAEEALASTKLVVKEDATPNVVSKVDVKNVILTDSKYQTVRPGEMSAEIMIRHAEKLVTDLAITAPTKSEYFVGAAELDLTGLVVTATYNDESVVDVTDYTVEGFDSATAGEKTITVSFGGKTAEFKINVVAPTLENIAVTAPTKVDYFVGDAALDLAGLKVTASYNDGSSVDVTDYTVEGFDSATAGEKTITVSFGGKTAEFKINVAEAPVTENPVTALEITKKKSSIVYRTGLGSKFAITATYADGTTKDVTSEVTVSGYDKTTPIGKAVVTFTLGDKSVSTDLKVIPRRANIKSLKKLTKKSVKIKWKRLPKVKGYKIYMSTKAKKGFKLIKTIKKYKTIKYIKKGLKAKKKYYFYTVSYKKVSGVTYKSKKSKIKSIKL